MSKSMVKTNLLLDAISYKDTQKFFALLKDDEVDLKERSDNNKSVLHLAIQSGDAAIIQALLDSKAVEELNHADNFGRTPLILAVSVNRPDIVSAMLDIPGIDMNSKDMVHKTALDWAVSLGFTDVENLILRKLNLSPRHKTKNESKSNSRSINTIKDEPSISIYELVDLFVEYTEQKNKKELDKIISEFNNKVEFAASDKNLAGFKAERSSEKTIDDLNSLAQNIKFNKSMQEILSAVEHAKKDIMFNSKLYHLAEAASEIINKQPYETQNIIAMQIYLSLIKHRPFSSKAELWVPNFSFLHPRVDNKSQVPMGKRGAKEAKFPLAILKFMALHYWEDDTKSPPVHYFDKNEKKMFKVRKNEKAGDFVLFRNYDHKSDKDNARMPAGRYLYSVSLHGGLVAANEQEVPKIHHSTFRSGQPVIAAGYITVDEPGHISEITSWSGHMGTPDINLFYTALYLFEKGFVSANCKVNASFGGVLTSRSLPKGAALTVHQLLTLNDLQIKDDNLKKVIAEASEKYKKALATGSKIRKNKI